MSPAEDDPARRPSAPRPGLQLPDPRAEPRLRGPPAALPREQLISIAAFDTSGNGFTWIAHKMVTIPAQTFGHIDSATATAPAVGSPTGTIRVVGFGIDIDAFESSQVRIRLNGRTVRTITANRYRSDIAQAYPHLGGNYGFDEVMPAKPGRHELCVTVLNVNSGSNANLGCMTVVVPANPRGVLETANSTGPGTIRLLGWAQDADTSAAIAVRVTVDGTSAGQFPANRARSDGHDGHGFDITLTGIDPGDHEVCVTALNVGGGKDVGLGCMEVPVASDALGAVTELAAAPGGMVLSATALKRLDGRANAVLRVLVDDHYRASIRPGAVGTTEFVSLPEGSHEVTVVSTVEGPRTVPMLLASASLDVPAAPPERGALEASAREADPVEEVSQA
ncbi:MAG: hypothetical protein R2716_10030 [Microthrixaceae bacterium]